jgi:hypothetical protein
MISSSAPGSALFPLGKDREQHQCANSNDGNSSFTNGDEFAMDTRGSCLAVSKTGINKPKRFRLPSLNGYDITDVD